MVGIDNFVLCGYRVIAEEREGEDFQPKALVLTEGKSVHSSMRNHTNFINTLSLQFLSAPRHL